MITLSQNAVDEQIAVFKRRRRPKHPMVNPIIQEAIESGVIGKGALVLPR